MESVMKAWLLAPTLFMSVCLGAYALDSTDAVQNETAPPADTAQVAPPQGVDTAVQVRNNSAFAIYVIQKGVKQEVASKGTYVVSSAATYPLSITPVSGTPSIKFVTFTRKSGACTFASCLIVQ
ncbi:hypothetical protein ALP86_02938 [Pseudomonas amygdali pv. mori]|uniref:Alginate biosynthesis protein AlgF n=3 Tax=Pseudomonas syringae group genomosp. 2 TaxID=251698 RepID=A0A3M5BDY2_PSESS|nr:Uncharacterized protein ALO82_00908 [Pseudomonas syringae pv. broussonetiae]RMR39493.1 hypothetical protein ALP86_02938 [Pseudomonas amygdali pv. mori]RMS23620.1 hypothetical protein ALP70_03712 [Pseudomonas savastanoi]RMT18556.1 hypothetical protein ALP51_00531 [Pseudomonas savastanoi]RMT23832.1 hypothetical protein ALP52_100688 [Pseudomonas amygdali pv. mori]